MAGYTINHFIGIYIYILGWYIQHGLARPIRIIAIQSWKRMILWGLPCSTEAAFQVWTRQHQLQRSCAGLCETLGDSAENSGGPFRSIPSQARSQSWAHSWDWRQLVLASGGMTGGLFTVSEGSGALHFLWPCKRQDTCFGRNSAKTYHGISWQSWKEFRTYWKTPGLARPVH